MTTVEKFVNALEELSQSYEQPEVQAFVDKLCGQANLPSLDEIVMIAKRHNEISRNRLQRRSA